MRDLTQGIDCVQHRCYVVQVVRAPQNESTPTGGPEQDPFVPLIIEHLRHDGHLPRRDLAPVRAWDRAKTILAAVTADELRDSYRTLKEAHRRQDPDLDYWRDAFHGKLERFLNQ